MKNKTTYLNDPFSNSINGTGIKKFEGIKKYLSTESIKDNKIRKIEAEITLNNRPSRANVQPVEGDVIFARMQNTEKVLIVNEKIEKDYIFSTGFMSIKPKQNVLNSNYLAFFFKSKYFKIQKDKLCNGGTQKALNNKAAEKIKIPLPSIEKQKQIAKALDKVNELVELRKISITKLDELSKSIFIDMFGDPLSNPKNWETILLNDIGTWLGGGTPSRSNPEYFTGNIPWITTVSLGDLYIDQSFAVEFITNEAITKSATKLIPKNSIIIGTRVGVGKVSINTEGICTNQDIISITNIHKGFNNIFIFFFIKSYTEVLNSFKRGATIQGITSSNLKSISLITPGIDLQNKFAKIIEKIEEQKSLYTQELEKLQENFDALLQKSFQE